MLKIKKFFLFALLACAVSTPQAAFSAKKVFSTDKFSDVFDAAKRCPGICEAEQATWTGITESKMVVDSKRAAHHNATRMSGCLCERAQSWPKSSVKFYSAQRKTGLSVDKAQKACAGECKAYKMDWTGIIVGRSKAKEQPRFKRVSSGCECMETKNPFPVKKKKGRRG